MIIVVTIQLFRRIRKWRFVFFSLFSGSPFGKTDMDVSYCIMKIKYSNICLLKSPKNQHYDLSVTIVTTDEEYKLNIVII